LLLFVNPLRDVASGSQSVSGLNRKNSKKEQSRLGLPTKRSVGLGRRNPGCGEGDGVKRVPGMVRFGRPDGVAEGRGGIVIMVKEVKSMRIVRMRECVNA
jgi:hypothetical protein